MHDGDSDDKTSLHTFGVAGKLPVCRTVKTEQIEQFFSAAMPPTSIRPESGRARPVNMDIVVVFPAPFGPRKPKKPPSATSKSIPSTAQKFPNRFTRPWARIAALSEVAIIAATGLKQAAENALRPAAARFLSVRIPVRCFAGVSLFVSMTLANLLRRTLLRVSFQLLRFFTTGFFLCHDTCAPWYGLISSGKRPPSWQFSHLHTGKTSRYCLSVGQAFPR